MATMGVNNNLNTSVIPNGLNSNSTKMGSHHTNEETAHVTTEDEVSPVNQRLLTKATTPPITIKNFFKPVQKSKNTMSDSAENIIDSLENESLGLFRTNTNLVGKGKSKDGKGKGKKAKQQGNTEKFLKDESNSVFTNSDIGVSNSVDIEDTSIEVNVVINNSASQEQLSPRTKAAIALIDQKTAEYRSSSETDGKCKAGTSHVAEVASKDSNFEDFQESSMSGSSPGLCYSPKPASSLAGSVGQTDHAGTVANGAKNSGNVSLSSKKRTNSVLAGMLSKGPPNKKAKQGNILQSLKKQKSIQEEKEKKQLCCPICSKEFDQGTSNVEINKHVDNCLIE